MSSRNRRRRVLRRALALAGLVSVAWVAARADRRRSLAAARSEERLAKRSERPIRDREVTGPAGRLRVLEAGEGEPTLVLLHGLGGRAGHFRRVLAAAELPGRWLAPELRGHGESAAGEEAGQAPEDLAADVFAALEALSVDRAVVCGQGLGAAVALALAQRSPQRVAGLALLDPFADPDLLPVGELETLLSAVDRDPRGELRWMIGQLLAGDAVAIREEILGDLGSTSVAVLRATLRAVLEWRPQEALESYTGPIQLLSTDREDLPHSVGARNPQLPVRRLLAAGHWPMLATPAALAGCLLELASSIRGRLA